MQQLTNRSIRALQTGTDESNSSNIRSALARGLSEFSPALCKHDGHFVIAASGPSLPSFLEEIKQERLKGRPICAINGAHDFLVSNGVEPDLFVTCDPKNTILGNVQKKNANTVYLLASRVSPEVFDHLSDKKIVLWHSLLGGGEPKPDMKWEDFELSPECQEFRGHLGVGGGTTSGTRAIYIGYLMGFRNFILYGMDSCLAKDRYTKRFSGENIGRAKLIDVIVDGKRFFSNGAMALQASEFQDIVNHLTDAHFEAKGDGLIAAILSARKKRGYRT